MIQDLDRSLERLLRDRVPLRTEAIRFDAPNDDFRTRITAQGPTISLYLYDLRENHDLRSPDWSLDRQPDGKTVKRRPTVRMDLSYVITTWYVTSDSTDPRTNILQEHTLLSQILRTLLCYPTLPPELLQGELIGQEPPLPTLVAQPESMRNSSDFWGAMRQSPRPSIHLVVTIAMEPTTFLDIPVILTPAISKEWGFGSMGGMAYQLGVRSPLPQRYEAGTPIQRMQVAQTAIAQLQQPVFASQVLIRANQTSLLPSNEWVFIEDGTNPEFIRLGEVPGAGVQDIPLALPLRFSHTPTPTIPLRRVRTPDPDPVISWLTTDAVQGTDTLQLSTRTGIVANDGLLISDGNHTEVVRAIVLSGTDAGPIQVSPTLRFPHPANCNLYKRQLDNTTAQLVQPAAQSGSSLVPDQGLPGGSVLMVGIGVNAEFCRLTAAGNPVAVAPPLRNNHPANTPLRLLTAAERVGQLQVAAPVGGQEVVVAADPLAVETARRQRRSLLNAGEILQIDQPTEPLAFQITAVTETVSAVQGALEAFISLGGMVTDNAGNPNPITGAQVVLRQQGTGDVLQLQAVTTSDGSFRFVNLFPGSYSLQVTALGYQEAVKTVQVPAQTVDDYRITLSP